MKKEESLQNRQAVPARRTSVNVRYMAVTAMLSAVSFILMFFEFWVPFTPSFLKMDFSDLPALIGTFTFGPVCGILVTLIKNLLHLTTTQSGGVGELSNFLLGVAFVLPAGLIYKRKRTKKGALIASLTGAVIMAISSIFINYFLIYPFYTAFMQMDTNAIISAYQLIIPSIDNLLEALVYINLPFTFIKAMFSVIVTFVLYKHISPILRGRNSY
ncbi:MAG: ECF transporter S component [Lachnospiraceae bacterium]